MVALKFASSHNMVAFLDKPTESDRFEQIMDFLNAHPIKYALTVNPTIYTACIEQLWATTKVKTVNGEVQIQALVDKKKVIITETSIRSNLQLEDVEVLRLLLGMNLVALWPLLSSVLPQTKNSTFPMFLDKQVEGMSKHKEIYVTSSHTKNVFANMKRHGKDFFGRDTPLFPTMIVQAQEQVGEEKIKTSQAAKITELKKRVKKLEGKKKSKPPGMKRLFKIGRSARVVSSEVEGLGHKEDASKQGRKIDEIEQDAEVTLVDETQGSYGDNLMFDTGVLDNEQDMAEKEVDMAEKDVSIADLVTTAVEVVTIANIVVSTAKVTTDSTTTTTVDELTLAQTLIKIKAAKLKARGAKDKGKEKMVEPEKPLKKKDHIMFDKEVAQKLQAQLDAELEEEEEKLARQREEDANIAEWDNVQAMMDADFELAARLQAEEQGELTIEEKPRLFVELMNKRKKHF
ncbi:hypothetical protein Tco_0276331 [Tanacetum coccineum]